MSQMKYDTTLARIAGNIAAGMMAGDRISYLSEVARDNIAKLAVDLAKRIVGLAKDYEVTQHGR